MRFFKKTIIVYIIILTLCFAVSCGEKLNAETKPAEDNLSDDVSIGSETNNTSTETVTESSTIETEALDERIITVNGVSAFKNADGKIYLYDDDENKPLTESEYDNVHLWQDMLLLEKNNKEYLYNADYSGTLEQRQRRGFLFPDLTEGFDDITQINSGIYVIEANGKKFPACISPNKIFEDIDCSKINHIAEGRILAESYDGKTGLYYTDSGYFCEIFPQSADEIIYSETIYNEDGDRFNIFFVKKDGVYSVYIDGNDGFSQRASDNVYNSVKIDSDGAVTAVRGGKTYYISCYDGSESSDAPKDYRIIQTVGDYQIIRYYKALGCGVINGDNTVIPCEYGMIRAVADDRFFCSKIKGEDGVILDNNNTLIAEGFRFVYPLEAPDNKNTLYIVEKYSESKVVLIDKDGNIINTGNDIDRVEYGCSDTYIINGDICFTPQ